jgi:hypothetical protein
MTNEVRIDSGIGLVGRSFSLNCNFAMCNRNLMWMEIVRSRGIAVDGAITIFWATGLTHGTQKISQKRRVREEQRM